MAVSILASEPSDNIGMVGSMPGTSRTFREPAALFSLGFVLVVCASALLVPWLSPYMAGGLGEKRILQAARWGHWMGPDEVGRDLLTRRCYRGRVSLTLGVGTALLPLIISTNYGLLSC